jgi:pyruvate formate lyase activating enzyme
MPSPSVRKVLLQESVGDKVRCLTCERRCLLAEAGLDAMNVNVKGNAETVRQYCGTDVEVVWRNCRVAQEHGAWIELTTLVIPSVNEDDETLGGIARRIAAELGPDTPWHLSRYYPAYQFATPPTPLATLERAREIGLEAGLRYVYLGNVHGHPAENTFCPKCGTILAERGLLQLLNCKVTLEGRCPSCGEEIAGVGWNWRQDAEYMAN